MSRRRTPAVIEAPPDEDADAIAELHRIDNDFPAVWENATGGPREIETGRLVEPLEDEDDDDGGLEELDFN